ncbi:MAG: SPOR domain-containing protein, partial [Dysgonamonadaceae bacterium]|nr:SPOR domain-containing protein [Dysgonamonadaceae bacterium]
MKTTVCFWAFFFFLSAFGHLQAQDTSGIINELNRNDASKGKVFVYQDESIKDLVGKPVGSLRSDAATTRMFGYKIQAFSGNNQRTSKDEAYSKQAQINTAFPGLETKIIFES